MILDLFAGPGGWSEGLRLLDPSLHAGELGLEWEPTACRTRHGAGHRTIRADIARYPTEPFVGKVRGLIISPPCTDFSMAGRRAGLGGESGYLVAEVLRWGLALMPEWIACEQVPPVLGIWRDYAATLRWHGYSTWAGILNAADFGVPQTRRRAFLLASRTREAQPPTPTHARTPRPSLWGPVPRPWVSMANALGLTPGFVAHYVRGTGMTERHGPRPDTPSDSPAPTLTGAALGGTGGAKLVLIPGRTPSQPNRRPYDEDEPAPTMAFGHDSASWCWEQPATTVAGDGRVTARCHYENGSQGANPKTTIQVRAGDYDGTEPIKLTVAEALVLQSFPADYPLQGSKTSQFAQIGNAVPPLLAAHVLASITGTTLKEQE